MKFYIQARSLSDFFRERHADVLDVPKYAGGDVTRMSHDALDSVAEHSWGLSNEGYQNGTYEMKVINQQAFRTCGIEDRGRLVS